LSAIKGIEARGGQSAHPLTASLFGGINLSRRK
jgi:hypothetical protein